MTTSNNLQEAVNRHLAANKLTPKALGALVGLSDFTIRKAAKTGTATQATVEKLSTQIDSAWMAAAVADFFPAQAVSKTLEVQAAFAAVENPTVDLNAKQSGFAAEPTFAAEATGETAGLEDFPGAVAVRKNRTTKAIIVIIDRHNGVRGNKADLVKRWLVRCNTHNTEAETGDRAVANYGTTYPWSWCMGCHDQNGANGIDPAVKYPYPDQPHRSL